MCGLCCPQAPTKSLRRSLRLLCGGCSRGGRSYAPLFPPPWFSPQTPLSEAPPFTRITLGGTPIQGDTARLLSRNSACRFAPYEALYAALWVATPTPPLINTPIPAILRGGSGQQRLAHSHVAVPPWTSLLLGSIIFFTPQPSRQQSVSR